MLGRGGPWRGPSWGHWSPLESREGLPSYSLAISEEEAASLRWMVGIIIFSSEKKPWRRCIDLPSRNAGPCWSQSSPSVLSWLSMAQDHHQEESSPSWVSRGSMLPTPFPPREETCPNPGCPPCPAPSYPWSLMGPWFYTHMGSCEDSQRSKPSPSFYFLRK